MRYLKLKILNFFLEKFRHLLRSDWEKNEKKSVKNFRARDRM